MSITFIDKLPVHSSVDEEEMHYLNGMTLVRHHAYSAYNKTRNLPAAQHIVDKRFIEGDINIPQNVGLDLELRFFHDYKKKLKLIPALDCGEKVDFVGSVQGRMICIDVTTNVSFKAYADYLVYTNHFVVTWDKAAKRWSWYVPDKNAGLLRKVK